MMKIEFTTDGLIDLEAFNTFGISVKPNTENPIGYFGTGLKYAIAVCLRHKQEVTLYRGQKVYHFTTAKGTHRGKEFEWISMSKKKGIFNKHQKLPFTTELGKNWELWQAYRELHANTVDEQGLIRFISGEPLHTEPGVTKITVEGSAFVDEYHNRKRTFLTEALNQRVDDKSVQIFDNLSQHVYYRGIRILDVNKPAIFTYNLLSDLRLTEDRTAKSTYEVTSSIAQHVATDIDDVDVIERILNADDSKWESRLDFDSVYYTPSEHFKEALSKRRRDGITNPTAERYYERFNPAPVPKKPDYKKHAWKFLQLLNAHIADHPNAWEQLTSTELNSYKYNFEEIVRPEDIDDTPTEEIPF